MRHLLPHPSLVTILLCLLTSLAAAAAAGDAAAPRPAGKVPAGKVKAFLGPRTIAILDKADRVGVFRLWPPGHRERASEQMDGYGIADIGKEQGKAFAAKVVALLYDEKTYDFDVAKACDPTPGVGFRVISDEGVVDVLLCFECNELLLFTTDGKVKEVEHRTQNFDNARAAFLELAKEAFPHDKEIAALK